MIKTNLELKYYCSDFHKLRKVLIELGAKKEIIKKQTDYFFNIPNEKARMKLRIEGMQQFLVYYERPAFSKSKSTISKIKLYEIKDEKVLLMLSETLGVKAIVRKKREVWRKENVYFHLDNVVNVGRIFEIELQNKRKISPTDYDLFRQYRIKLLPYLGKMIKGSNVDLILSR